MSSRIQSDLLLVDAALRSSPSRALLKGGSADAWAGCKTSLQAVLLILRDSVLADQSVSTAAAVSIHWRKSSASKKLLVLLRAVIEEAHALQGDATAARTIRCCAVHGSISAINFFWQRKQSAALWPALREWIVDLGGITSLWTALAWVVRIPMQDEAAEALHELLRASVHAVLALTHGMFGVRQPAELVQNSAVITVLSSVLGNLLPRDFAVGNAETWSLGLVYRTVMVLEKLDESVLSAHLHRPLLVFWPYLMMEMRRQSCLRPEPTGVSTPSGLVPVLYELKVQMHALWATIWGWNQGSFLSCFIVLNVFQQCSHI